MTAPVLAMERLPDQLADYLRLVFVGTAASRRSADVGHYYAHPGNRFWRTLHQTGITNRRYEPHEFPALLTQGIGFTDLCKTGAGMDHQALAFPVDIRRIPGKDAELSAAHDRLHQQEGREPVLRTTDDSDRVGPAAAPCEFPCCVRADLAIRRGVGQLVDCAMAGIGRCAQIVGLAHPTLTRSRQTNSGMTICLGQGFT